MKKLLGILVLGLLFCNLAKADAGLIKSIDEAYKRLGTADSDTSVFLLKELAFQMEKGGQIAIKCYRFLNVNPDKHNSNQNCRKFKLLLGNTHDDLIKNTKKVRDIILAEREKYKSNFYNKYNETDAVGSIQSIGYNFKVFAEVLTTIITK